MTQRNIHRTDFSRVWLLEGRAGPANAPDYESHWKAGAADWSQGDVSLDYLPDPEQYGQFIVIGKTIGEPDSPTLPITARYEMDVRSVLLKMTKLGCDHDLQVHIGECRDPQDFNAGWTKVLALEQARISSYSTTDLGALGPDERERVSEEVEFQGELLYEIVPIAFGAQASAEIVQEVVGIIVCDSISCATCGITSDGCSVVFAVTLSIGGSPGLPAEVVYTVDGGANYDDTNIDTLAPNQDPNGLACVGANLIVISEDSESLHYAPIADILDGAETWNEVTSGFVTGNGPLAITNRGNSTWIVAENGYVYYSEDPTSAVTVQNAGAATTEDLHAIHAYDHLSLVAVGDNNAVISTADGETWGVVTGPAVGVNLTSVWMHTKVEWFVGTANGRLWYTTNGGDTWVEKAFTGSGTGVVRDIKFTNGTVGWMSHDTAAPSGRILRTINGGYSWYVTPEGVGSITDNDKLNALAICQDPNIIYAAGLGANAVDGIAVKGTGV